MSTIIESLKHAGVGIFIFVQGFILGMALDIIFFKLYEKTDQKKKSTSRLVGLMAIQLYILLFLVDISGKLLPDYKGKILIMGLISSQLFLLEFAMEKISTFIYDREHNKSDFKQYLNKIPLLQGVNFF